MPAEFFTVYVVPMYVRCPGCGKKMSFESVSGSQATFKCEQKVCKLAGKELVLALTTLSGHTV